MRKFKFYVLLGLLGLSIYGCNKDQASTPPQPSFSVDKTSGLVGSTVFTFTVNKVDADAISLFPYGTDDKTKGGIVLHASDFVGGVATVTFTYSFVGTFSAVVVANKHSSDGGSIKNVTSAAQSITVTNNLSAISAFSLTDNTTDSKNPVTVDGKITGTNIDVTIPYANGGAITKLVATFTASDFSTTTVSGAAQTSGTTANNFTSPVTYTVKSQDGSSTTAYTVTVTVTAAETDNTLKSSSGTNISASFKKKVVPAAVDNIARTIVVYDTIGTVDFDSVRVKYEFNGKFATASMKEDTLLNLSSAKTISITSESGDKADYKIYAAAAPKLTLSFDALVPAVDATTTNFGISADVLTGTDVTSIITNATIDLPTGVIVTGVTAGGSAFVTGSAVDYSSKVDFVLSVTDSNLGISYEVTYSVTVNVVK